MQTTIKIGDKVYQIEISETRENLLKVKVNDKEFLLSQEELIESQQNWLEEKENEIVSPGLTEREIKSPLAGTISSIFVKKGQTLKPGEKVATLISMKMENEILSEGYGKVKEIKIKENQFVNSGETLIILE